MTYVIGEPCIDIMDRACVEECPVDCIYEGARSLLLSCAAVILVMVRVEDRRLSRQLRAAQDRLRRARLELQQRRRIPPGSPPPAQGGSRSEARPGSR